jgi:hypothetical protein
VNVDVHAARTRNVTAPQQPGSVAARRPDVPGLATLVESDGIHPTDADGSPLSRDVVRSRMLDRPSCCAPRYRPPVRKRLVPALLVIALLVVAGVGALRWHRHQQRDEAAGQNDVAAEPAEVGDAAGALFRQLTAAGATVYAVGPAPAPARPADDVAAVDEALRQASTAAGVTYISAITWDLEYGPDDLHPTEEGQRDFATRVAEVVNAP